MRDVVLSADKFPVIKSEHVDYVPDPPPPPARATGRSGRHERQFRGRCSAGAADRGRRRIWQRDRGAQRLTEREDESRVR